MVVGYHHFRKPPIFCYFHGNAVYFTYEKNETRGASRRRFCGLRSNGGILGLVKSRLFAHQAGKTTTLKPPEVGVGSNPQSGRQHPKHCRRLKTVLSTMYIYIYTRIYRMYNRFCYLNIGMFLAWFSVEVSNILDFSSFCLHFFQRQDARGFLSKHRRT